MSDVHLLERRLLLFTGKGGVGKSTVVAALALELAFRGRRPLIVELGHRASMEGIFAQTIAASGSLEDARIGYAPREVGHGVWAMNLDFEGTLHDYMAEHVRIAGIARAILRNQTLQRFFHSAPAIAEIAALNKLSALERERLDGAPRWDPILVDLDATGHALMLLNLPRVMDGLVGDGPLRQLVDGFSRLLTDPRKTSLNLVTLPAELPAQETCELYARLKAEHRVALGVLFINQVPDPIIEPGDAASLAALGRAAASTGQSDALVAFAQRAHETHLAARDQIERIARDIPLPLVELPIIDSRALTLERMARLGRTVLSHLAGRRESAMRGAS